MTMPSKPSTWRMRVPELALATVVVTVAGLLVVPLPPALLDVLLAMNLAGAMIILLTGLSVRRPLSISSFPAVLLITTLLRLGLNVSSTRLILGEGFAGRVIDAFASWVVTGSFVVGVVIFLILTVIQFIVIARGGERVAEVAARFALDAMPGRQMAIDADVRSGALSPAQARIARDELQRESRLYGAMDGAMKFVKGDAIAGLFILSVDLLGGIAVGVVDRGMSVGDALRHYGLLTIGDGLVTQIPALLIALGAALVVTRVASVSEETEQHLGADIVSQLGSHPRALGYCAVFMVGLGAVPGLPALPFLVLAAACGAAAVAAARASATDATQSTPPSSVPPALAVLVPETLDVVQRRILCEAIVERAALRGVQLTRPQVDGHAHDEVHVVVDGAVTRRLPARAERETIVAEVETLLPSLLSMQDVKRLLARWETREAALVSSVVPGHISLYRLTQLMRYVLSEGLDVAPLRRILEATLAVPRDAPLASFEDEVRVALGGQLVEVALREERPLLEVGPRMARLLSEALGSTGNGEARLGAAAQRELRDALAAAAATAGATGLDDCVIAVEGRCRRLLAAVVAPVSRQARILSFEELAAAERVGMVPKARFVSDVGAPRNAAAVP